MDTPRRAARSRRSPSLLEPVTLSRRRFLVVAGGAAAYATLRPGLSWARRFAHPSVPLQPWTLPSAPPSDPLELGRALAGAAVLAPSQWNTQPWKLEINGTTIRLLADPGRAMPVNDPERCGMMMSLGAALENLLVAMRAYGLRPTVTYFPAGEKAVATVSGSRAETRRDRDLFAVIPERRTNRRTYDGRGLFMQSRAALSAQVPGELRLYWVDGRDSLRRVADLAHDASRARVLDRAAESECYAWTRFGDDDARRRGDGVTIDDLELNGPARWLAGRSLHPGSRFLGLGAANTGKQAREQIRSAGALALLTTPTRRESAWLAAGQTYERMALRATQLGIAHQPVNAPVERAAYRADLMRAFGAIDEQPLLLLRLGHANPPRPSMRRAVSLVASFRAS